MFLNYNYEEFLIFMRKNFQNFMSLLFKIINEQIH